MSEGDEVDEVVGFEEIEAVDEPKAWESERWCASYTFSQLAAQPSPTLRLAEGPLSAMFAEFESEPSQDYALKQ